MTDLTGHIALVTGASRGLGRAAAEAFAGAGAHVVALARTQGALEDFDDAVRAKGAKATLVPLDLSDDAGLARLGAALYERHGHLDLWLHTAAQAVSQSPVEHITASELDKALALDLRAFQRLIRVLDPLLRLAPEGRAKAVIASDGVTAEGARFRGLYAMAKAGQSALTQAWAVEAGGRFCVAEIIPPAMPTALRARFYPGEDQSALTPCAVVAERLLAALPQLSAGGRVALTDA
ncbi:MAG: SDR family oxidoreductase [Pseudomonadota bacterium]